MKKLLLILIATAFVTGTTGCMSMASRKDEMAHGLIPAASKDGPYAATKEAVRGLKDDHPISKMLSGVIILDLPLTFALDTALLPLDILGAIFKDKDDDADKPEAPQPKPTPQP